MKSRLVMDEAAFQATLERLAREIADKVRDLERPLALVGIRTRGVPLAGRLARAIEASTRMKPTVGALDITLYRDDVGEALEQPVVRNTALPFRLDDAWVILVDDVLFTGRTARAAITELLDFGRPRRIELLVMIERGWRELPIQADYVGKALSTDRQDRVRVLLSEEDGRDAVLLESGSP